MDPLGITASVAGVLTLAGQALVGIVALHDFFQSCSSASKTIANFLRELNAFKRTIQDVQEVVAKIQASFEHVIGGFLVSLTLLLEDSVRDVTKWLEKARSTDPRSTSGTKAVFKAFLVALQKQSIRNYFLEIANHKKNLTLSLSVIGR